ncbi:hypothetical protein AAMO2058_000041100 [Amorphochlora amoebiformis]
MSAAEEKVFGGGGRSRASSPGANVEERLPTHPECLTDAYLKDVASPGRRTLWLCRSGVALYEALDKTLGENLLLIKQGSAKKDTSLFETLANQAIEMVEGYTLTLTELIIPPQCTLLGVPPRGGGGGRDRGRKESAYSRSSGSGSWSIVKKWQEDFGYTDKASHVSSTELTASETLTLFSTLSAISTDLAPRLMLSIPCNLPENLSDFFAKKFTELCERLQRVCSMLLPTLGVRMASSLLSSSEREWNWGILGEGKIRGGVRKGGGMEKRLGPVAPEGGGRFHTDFGRQLSRIWTQSQRECTPYLSPSDGKAVAARGVAYAIRTVGSSR